MEKSKGNDGEMMQDLEGVVATKADPLGTAEYFGEGRTGYPSCLSWSRDVFQEGGF